MAEQLELRIDRFSAYDRAEHAERARICQWYADVECDRIGFMSELYRTEAEYHQRKAEGHRWE